MKEKKAGEKGGKGEKQEDDEEEHEGQREAGGGGGVDTLKVLPYGVYTPAKSRRIKSSLEFLQFWGVNTHCILKKKIN